MAKKEDEKKVEKKVEKNVDKNVDKKKAKVIIEAPKKKKKASIETKSDKTTKTGISSKKKEEESEDDELQVSTLVKGGYAVDHLCPHRLITHVLIRGGVAFDATLNQSNIGHNNNKFYILQVLQSDSAPNISYFFTRWGRVGVPGQ